MLIRFLQDESATTAIEYSLIALLASLAVIMGATTIGSTVNGMIAAVVPYL